MAGTQLCAMQGACLAAIQRAPTPAWHCFVCRLCPCDACTGRFWMVRVTSAAAAAAAPSPVQALWRRKPNNDDDDWVLQNQDEYFHEVSESGAQEGE